MIRSAMPTRVQLYFVQNPAAGWRAMRPGRCMPQPHDWPAAPTVGTAADADHAGFQLLRHADLRQPGNAERQLGQWRGMPPAINFNFTGTTLGAQTFAVAGTTNDGLRAGQL